MRHALAALTITALLSGCAVTLQDRPSAGPATAASCSSSKLWIADLALTVIAVGATAYGVSRVDDTGNILAGGAGIAAVVAGGSAATGLRWNRECRSGGAATMTAAR